MKTKKIVLLVALLLAIFMLKAQDVYVVGAKKIGTPYVAGFWKNGVFTQVGSGAYTSYATSIYVSGNNIYIGGYESNGTVNVAKCWKKIGDVTTFEESSYSTSGTASQIQSISVTNGDVYATGFDGGNSRTARYWKNSDSPVILGTRYSSGRSILVSNNNIYVAGQENGTSTPAKSEAKYWKNGAETLLESNASSDIYATSIFVKGEDVYVAGYEHNGTVNIPKYWKNGNVTTLSTGTALAKTEITAGSIFVSENDVYVSGYEVVGSDATIYFAKCWKNGEETILTGTDFTKSKSRSVYVHNNNVYVAGSGTTASLGIFATYWKDGVATILEPTTASDAFGIMVVDAQTGFSDNLNNNVKLFYNKSTTNIEVTGLETRSIISLYDSNGKQLMIKTISGKDIFISSKTVPAGIYFAKIVNNGNVMRYKFVIER